MSLASRVKTDLATMGRGALKLRGQHFLISDTVLDRIVETSGVKKGDRVLEIGPGLGFLTERLIAAGAEAITIELDEAFADHLEKQFGIKITLIRGDALKTDFTTLFDGKPFRVIANIPYGITSKLLEKIVAHADRIESATLLVQKEVADRVAAKPGSMNMLALIVQSVFDARVGFVVSAGSFMPPPKVASAVLTLSVIPETQQRYRGSSDTTLDHRVKPDDDNRPDDDKGWIKLARKAFNAPRKKISTTLKLSDEIFKKAGLTGDERPAELGMEEWRRLGLR